MANYIAVCVSNAFRVTDEAAYEHLAARLCPDAYRVDKDGFHLIGCYDTLDYKPYPSQLNNTKSYIESGRTIFDEDHNAIPVDKIDEYNKLCDDKGNVLYNEETTDYDFYTFLRELQKLLPDGEHFTFYECGHEKLRSVDSYAVFMTNKVLETTTLEEWMNDMIKQYCPEDQNTQLP
jgi:hypothetical protein